MTASRHRRGRRPQSAADPLALHSRLTSRDHALMRLLDQHGVLTTDHISALLYPNRDTAQHRLVELWRWHLLDRFRRISTDRLDLLHGPWHYTLGHAGAVILAASRGESIPRPRTVRMRTLRLANHPGLDHLLGTNGFFASLTAYARTSTGSVERWLGERAAARACGTLARPDGLGDWHDEGGRLVFCLEHDTGSEPLKRVAAKLDGYASLADATGPRLSGPDGDTGHAGPFWVLLHLHSPQREAAAREVLRRHPAAPQPGDGWGVATTTHHQHAEQPGEPIWLTLHHTRRRALTDLTRHLPKDPWP